MSELDDPATRGAVSMAEESKKPTLAADFVALQAKREEFKRSAAALESAMPAVQTVVGGTVGMGGGVGVAAITAGRMCAFALGSTTPAGLAAGVVGGLVMGAGLFRPRARTESEFVNLPCTEDTLREIFGQNSQNVAERLQAPASTIEEEDAKAKCYGNDERCHRRWIQLCRLLTELDRILALRGEDAETPAFARRGPATRGAVPPSALNFGSAGGCRGAEAGHHQHARDIADISVGARVEIQGIQARPQLNGMIGTVCGRAPNGRWKIRLENIERETVALKPINLSVGGEGCGGGGSGESVEKNGVRMLYVRGFSPQISHSKLKLSEDESVATNPDSAFRQYGILAAASVDPSTNDAVVMQFVLQSGCHGETGVWPSWRDRITFGVGSRNATLAHNESSDGCFRTAGLGRLEDTCGFERVNEASVSACSKMFDTFSDGNISELCGIRVGNTVTLQLSPLGCDGTRALRLLINEDAVAVWRHIPSDAAQIIGVSLPFGASVRLFAGGGGDSAALDFEWWKQSEATTKSATRSLDTSPVRHAVAFVSHISSGVTQTLDPSHAVNTEVPKKSLFAGLPVPRDEGLLMAIQIVQMPQKYKSRLKFGTAVLSAIVRQENIGDIAVPDSSCGIWQDSLSDNRGAWDGFDKRCDRSDANVLPDPLRTNSRVVLLLSSPNQKRSELRVTVDGNLAAIWTDIPRDRGQLAMGATLPHGMHVKIADPSPSERSKAWWSERKARALQQEANRLARADKPLPPNTRIYVDGHGRGTVKQSTNNLYAANSYTIVFDTGITDTLRLSDDTVTWTVFEGEMEDFVSAASKRRREEEHAQSAARAALVSQVVEQCRLDADTARTQLENCGWCPEKAIRMYQRSLTARRDTSGRIIPGFVPDAKNCWECDAVLGLLGLYHCEYCGRAVCRQCSSFTCVLDRRVPTAGRDAGWSQNLTVEDTSGEERRVCVECKKPENARKEMAVRRVKRARMAKQRLRLEEESARVEQQNQAISAQVAFQRQQAAEAAMRKQRLQTESAELEKQKAADMAMAERAKAAKVASALKMKRIQEKRKRQEAELATKFRKDEAELAETIRKDEAASRVALLHLMLQAMVSAPVIFALVYFGLAGGTLIFQQPETVFLNMNLIQAFEQGLGPETARGHCWSIALFAAGLWCCVFYARALRQWKKQREQLAAARKAQLEQLASRHRLLYEHLRIPEYWRHQCPDAEITRLPSSYQVLPIQKAMRGSAVSAVNGEDLRHCRVHKVERIENMTLWQNYIRQKQALREKLKSHIPQRLSGRAAVSRLCTSDRIIQPGPGEVDINEFWLWHGTRPDVASILAKDGFDERVAALQGLYGAGSYFADASSKSHQYSHEHTNQQGHCCMLYCRVTMGSAFLATKNMRGIPPIRRPPENPALGPGSVHDSILAESGVANSGQQHHNEYIVFHAAQVYPEFIVWYTHI